ncbi:hypothetical protein [Microbacterium schleiferi]|uniref:DUF3558 domain-containing protein n=1 Tax=Microbacterium schleiferi TaxID=69362 RepID=A0ABU7V4R9_9MICO|nr:hypothetical protein [Micrococcales bacterium]
MTPRRQPRAAFAALAVVPALLLVGCAAPDAAPTPTDVALDVAAEESADTDATTESAATGGAAVEGEPIPVPEGMPEVALYGCEDQLDYSVNETEFDTQWVWEFECRTPDPFWRTVDGLSADPAWTNTSDQRSGNDDFLTETLHYIADIGGVAGDVDLKAFGDAAELEVTYTVTLAKP